MSAYRSIASRQSGGSLPILFWMMSFAVGLGPFSKVSLASPPPELSFPETYESYFSRPDALRIQPKPHTEVNQAWRGLTRAHLEAIALVIEAYPDHELYFLARDAEYLYDLARFLTRAEPRYFKRLHLLNVSRKNMRAPHIQDYLAQEGISRESLRAGKKILLVDTGFTGTIPEVIQSYFPAELASAIRTHLICSANPAHPSTRVFLAHLNPAVNSLDPGTMHGSIITYEHMPRYTGRSDQFYYAADSRWHPLSSTYLKGDGTISKSGALATVENLLFEAQSPDFQRHFKLRRDQWRTLRSLVDEPQSLSKVSDHLKRVMSANPSDPLAESLVRDAVELGRKGVFPRENTPLLKDFGLLDNASGVLGSNKKALLEKFPQWQFILDDPETGIDELIKHGDLGTLGSIIDAVHDFEFSVVLAMKLGENAELPTAVKLIATLIEKNDAQVWDLLVEHTFSHENARHLNELLGLLIEKSPQKTLQFLAKFVFSQPHSIDREDLILRTIERGSPETWIEFAKSTFSKPHTRHMVTAIKLLIEKGDDRVRMYLAACLFSQPHAAELEPLLLDLIERGDTGSLRVLATDVFSKPHTEHMETALRKLIERNDPPVLQSLAQSTFTQPHTRQMRPLLRLLIERSGPFNQVSLARMFSEAHTADKEDLLRLFIEKFSGADSFGQAASFIFNRDHWNRPEYAYLKAALGIADRDKRVAYLNEHSLDPNRTMPQPTEGLPVPVHTGLTTGDLIQTESVGVLKVVRSVDEGKRGKVFQLRAGDGKLYALKVARDTRDETLRSIAQETDKAALYQKYSVPHAKIIEAKPTYVLKEWIEGTRADEWVAHWSNQGGPSQDVGILSLQRLIGDAARRGIYVGDLNAKNLIWTGNQWVVIDSGSVTEGHESKEALLRYLEKITDRWSRAQSAPAHCRELLGSALSGSSG